MNIPVLLEPTPNGFRASTGAPLNLTAEAPTADAALGTLRSVVVVKQSAGARIVQLVIPTPSPLADLAARLAANPLLDEWTAATKAYRQEQDAAEDAGRSNDPPSTGQEPAA
jgi:hypothetical protein